MDLTKLKIQSATVTNINFEDFEANKNKSSSGFLRITLDREDDVEVNEDSLLLFFSGLIAAYEGEESENHDDSSNAFNLNVKFTIKYSGEFDIDALSSSATEGESLFKKDASTFLNGVANRLLSDTNYNSVALPYQQ